MSQTINNFFATYLCVRVFLATLREEDGASHGPRLAEGHADQPPSLEGSTPRPIGKFPSPPAPPLPHCSITRAEAMPLFSACCPLPLLASIQQLLLLLHSSKLSATTGDTTMAGTPQNKDWAPCPMPPTGPHCAPPCSEWSSMPGRLACCMLSPPVATVLIHLCKQNQAKRLQTTLSAVVVQC